MASMTEQFVTFEKDNEHITNLKNIGFHAGFSLALGFEPMMMKRLDIPQLKWMLYLPEPTYQALDRQVVETSTNLPTVYPIRSAVKHQGMHTGIMHRTFNYLFYVGLDVIFNQLIAGQFKYT